MSFLNLCKKLKIIFINFFYCLLWKGLSLNCYECNSPGAECSPVGDDNYGELVECPAEYDACFTSFRYSKTITN